LKVLNLVIWRAVEDWRATHVFGPALTVFNKAGSVAAMLLLQYNCIQTFGASAAAHLKLHWMIRT
jgi:hypothetical protein